MTIPDSSLLRKYHVAELDGQQLWIALSISFDLPYLVVRYNSEGHLTHGFLYSHLKEIDDPYMFERLLKRYRADEIQYQENTEGIYKARPLVDHLSFSHPYVISLIQHMTDLSVLYTDYGYVATNGNISVVGKTFLDSAIKLCIMEKLGEYVLVPPLTSDTYKNSDIYPQIASIPY